MTAPMIVIMNPGTGPVTRARECDARRNLSALCRDLKLPPPRICIERDPRRDANGRYGYRLHRGIRTVPVEMPGLPLERVRMGPHDDAWQFPRLYVDGDSWLWPFAINNVQRALLDHDGAAERGYQRSVADCDFVMTHEPSCPTCGAIKDRHHIDEANPPYGYERLRCLVCAPVEETKIWTADLSGVYGTDEWKHFAHGCVHRVTSRRMPYEALGTEQDPICEVGRGYGLRCRLRHGHVGSCEPLWREIARDRVDLPYRGEP